MPLPATIEILFALFAFIFGATVGSFLNVCIHRLPRDLSVNRPKRSFCPACEKQIAWFHNLPLVSWLILRGRCHYCGAHIAFRYFLVELLTALLFLAIWLFYPFWIAPAFWVFVALLIVATFIDFEWFIIPDSITYGSVVAGLLLSMALPQLHGETVWWRGGLGALIGAAAGYFGLWAVVEIGKLAFGKKKIAFDQPTPFHFERSDEEPWVLVSEEDRLAWSEIIARRTDVLTIHCKILNIDGPKQKNVTLLAGEEGIRVGDRNLKPQEVGKIKGTMTSMIIPREAMGFGDVKFLAGIGAFLGWQGVLFTVFSSSVIGAVIGILLILLRREEWGTKLPYGPYLSLGALIWLFGGHALWSWYILSLQQPL